MMMMNVFDFSWTSIPQSIPHHIPITLPFLFLSLTFLSFSVVFPFFSLFFLSPHFWKGKMAEASEHESKSPGTEEMKQNSLWSQTEIDSFMAVCSFLFLLFCWCYIPFSFALWQGFVKHGKNFTLIREEFVPSRREKQVCYSNNSHLMFLFFFLLLLFW